MHSHFLIHTHTHTFQLNTEFHTVHSHRYTLSYPRSVCNFCWAAVPHFLINDLASALNQTLSLSHAHTHRHAHTHMQAHISYSYHTNTSQTHTNHKKKQIPTHMTNGVEGQRDAVFVTSVTDLQYVQGMCNSVCGCVCVIWVRNLCVMCTQEVADCTT